MKKTVRLFGPGFPRYPFRLLGGEYKELNGLVISAENLGDVLKQYSQAINASIRPYDRSSEKLPFAPSEEPKYFLLESANKEIRSSIIDIHIERDGKEICVKQNVKFELVDEDIVLICVPGC